MVSIRSTGNHGTGRRARTYWILVIFSLIAVVGFWWWLNEHVVLTGLFEMSLESLGSEHAQGRSTQLPPPAARSLPHQKLSALSSRIAPSHHHDWLTDDKTIGELWDESGCEELRKQAQPIPTPELWKLLRDTYVKVVGLKDSRIEWPRTDSVMSGIRVPYEAKQAAEKGRGVFASASIKAGTVVWSATPFTAVFKTADAYRTFLRLLPYYECCQAMGFSYALQTRSEGKHPWIAVDMDEGALFNSGSHGYGKKKYTKDISNLKCISETKEHPKGVCTAIQDIAPGDEFLCNYAGFSSGDLFRALGL